MQPFSKQLVKSLKKRTPDDLKHLPTIAAKDANVSFVVLTVNDNEFHAALGHLEAIGICNDQYFIGVLGKHRFVALRCISAMMLTFVLAAPP